VRARRLGREPAKRVVLDIGRAGGRDGTDHERPAIGVRQSGETVEFRHLADGTVASMAFGGGSLVRLGPVG